MSSRYSLLLSLILFIILNAISVYAQDNGGLDFRIQPQADSTRSGDGDTVIPLRITLAHTGSPYDRLQVDLIITAGQGVMFVDNGGFELDNALPQAQLSTVVDIDETRTYDLVIQALPNTVGHVYLTSTVMVNGSPKLDISEGSFLLNFGSDLIDFMETQPDIDGFRIAQPHLQDLQNPTDRSEIYIYVENTGNSPENYEVSAETFSQVVLDPDTIAGQQIDLDAITLLPNESRLVRIALQMANNARMGRYSVLIRVKTVSTGVVSSLLLPIAYGRAEFDPPRSAPVDLVENELYLDTIVLYGDANNPIRLSDNDAGELWIWIENTHLAAQARAINVRIWSRTDDLLFAENPLSASTELVIEGITLGPFEGIVIPIQLSLSEDSISGIYNVQVSATDSDGASTSERTVQVSVVD